MLSPEHVDYPYPTDAEKVELAAQAGVTLKQLSVWFTNARKRLWIPLRQMLGKPTPSYVDACLQRKVNNVADIVSRILPVGAAPVVTAVAVDDSASSDTFSSVTLRPEELVDLKASSAALAARKHQLLAQIQDLEALERKVQDAIMLKKTQTSAVSAQ